MSQEPEIIRHMLEAELQSLAESKGAGIVQQIRPILLTNLDRGRIQSFTEGRTDRISDYVWRVAEGFSSLHPYLHDLQIEHSAEAWEPLFERMQTWAYNFFLRKNFAAGDQTLEIAIECATEAAINLLNTHFPYDTEFDPWAHIIVQNACRKFIHHSLKKSAVPNEMKVELDDELVDPEKPLLELQSLRGELDGDLASALAQISEARRAVIQYLYFEELNPEETAQKMGKSVGAIYTLQFHALRDLRKILDRIRDNLNE